MRLNQHNGKRNIESNRKNSMKKMVKYRICQQLEKAYKANYKIFKKGSIKHKP